MLLTSLKVQFYILECEIKEVVQNQNQIKVTNSTEFVVIVFLYCEITRYKGRVSIKIGKSSFIYEVKRVIATQKVNFFV